MDKFITSYHPIAPDFHRITASLLLFGAAAGLAGCLVYKGGNSVKFPGTASLEVHHYQQTLGLTILWDNCILSKERKHKALNEAFESDLDGETLYQCKVGSRYQNPAAE